MTLSLLILILRLRSTRNYHESYSVSHTKAHWASLKADLNSYQQEFFYSNPQERSVEENKNSLKDVVSQATVHHIKQNKINGRWDLPSCKIRKKHLDIRRPGYLGKLKTGKFSRVCTDLSKRSSNRLMIAMSKKSLTPPHYMRNLIALGPLLKGLGHAILGNFV